MLPGKTYKPEDVLKILRKRIWLAAVPFAIVAAGTAAVARKLPDLYRSQAQIQVVPPQVPDSIIRPTNTLRLQDRLQASQQTILSRTRLERLIQEFNLYEAERKRMIMEDVVEMMRGDIRVEPTKGDSFYVQYVGRNPVTVMKVTERLASYFKDENALLGERRAEGTSSFVEARVEDARRKLVAMEDRLKTYKLAHVGEMPTQAQANLSAVQGIQQNIAQVVRNIETDTQTKASLEKNIAMWEANGDPATPLLAVNADINTGSAAQRLAAANAQMDNYRNVRRYTADNPSVRQLQNIIKTLQQQAEAEAKQVPVAVGAAMSPAEQRRLATIAAWKEEIETLKRRIAANEQEEKRLRAAAAGYQARLDRIPVREAELIELTREYGTLSSIYGDLVAKRETSNMSVDLERRQIGEQFILLDQARMPERPYSPDRMLINMLGILSGMVLGLGLVALVEYRDSTFKTDSEVAGVLGLPVLAVVPLMRSIGEQKAWFRRRLFLNLGFGSTVAVCLAVLAYTFVR